MTRQCANCDELIGNLETSHLWGEHTVCTKCFRILTIRSGEIPTAVIAGAPPSAQPQALPQLPIVPSYAPTAPAYPVIYHRPAAPSGTDAMQNILIADTLDALAVAAATRAPSRPRAAVRKDGSTRMLPWVTGFLAVALAVLIVVLVLDRFPSQAGSDYANSTTLPPSPADLIALPQAAPAPRDPQPDSIKTAAEDVPATPTADATPAPAAAEGNQAPTQAAAQSPTQSPDPAQNQASGQASVQPAGPSIIQGSSQSMVEGKGQVRFIITWKSNDFGGNHADAGAVALLIPKSLREKLPSSQINPESAELLLEDTRKVLAPYGAYVTIVDGDGKATIEGVSPGEYVVIVLSKNARDDQVGQAHASAQLGVYFDADSATTASKVYFSEAKVAAGDDVDVTHDFGGTSS